MSPCPSLPELQRFVAGDLDSTDAETIELHIDHCDLCTEILKSLTPDVPPRWRAWWQDVVHDPPPSSILDIDRYTVSEELGRGGFGTVYRCYDHVLMHDVAIKVPHAQRVCSAEDVDAFLDEARRWICLDHPGIARFLHADCANGSCYLVTKFIPGLSLAERMRRSRASVAESAKIVAQVARALHYVHEQELYHRDVKPSNILLDANDRPFLTDFGLALAEADVGTGHRMCGTLRYQSPEQASGEGHFVDGRTDIYSLGVVLYELLTGQVPFRAGTESEIREQIVRREPRPPRMIDDCVPKELERICLKAISKRLLDRYQTAGDLAEDLERWQEPTAVASRPKVVPKGLRSFDAEDAEFFLELLPSPRHRDGLPESIRFWKTRIEQTDPEQTFRVGLISGPSGCGKSSLVKAGLLPRLAAHVVPVYLEADATTTEARLLKSLRRSCPELPPDLNLVQSVAAIRTGIMGKGNRKVLIVLDQFEQWLHARVAGPGAEMIQSLRQCNGSRAQCIVMVRDDFATAVRRFMHQLEEPIAEYQNFAAFDIFDLNHARDVLAEFGRAYRQLPEEPSRRTDRQEEFLNESVKQLAENGMVIPVHLALFAHMVRGWEWVPETLQEIGGIEGIGLKFLEESFSRRNPEHLPYETAARQVLKALLPPKGTNIRGKVQSRKDLTEVAGGEEIAGDFDRLISILDDDLKLLTPTERDSTISAHSSSGSGGRKQLYQLTHDIMVPPLRRWLTRGQQTTRRGRAGLCLEERTSEWMQNRETRFLPTLLEWARIVMLTSPADRSATQQEMMKYANRYHVLRILLTVGICAILMLGATGLWSHVRELQADTERRAIVERIVEAETAQAIEILAEELPLHQPHIIPLLRDRLNQLPPDSQSAMHVRLALLPWDRAQLADLREDLLRVTFSKLGILRTALAPQSAELVPALWTVARNLQETASRRIRALAALAAYDPPVLPESTGQWTAVAPFVAEQLQALVQKNPSDFTTLQDLFREAKSVLYAPLRTDFSDRASPESKFWATAFLADFTHDDLDYRADLLLDADERQFRDLIEDLVRHPDPPIRVFHTELDKQPLPDWNDPEPSIAGGIPPSVTEQILDALGIINERFAFCLSISISSGVALHDEFQSLGFRLVRCRPFGRPGGVRMAAIWLNDAKEARAMFGVPAALLDKRLGELREVGHRVVDLAGYVNEDAAGRTTEQYVIISEASSGVDQKVLAGLGATEFEARATALREAGYRPATYQSYETAGEGDRYCSVWEQSDTETVLARFDMVDAQSPLEHLPIDIELSAARGTQPRGAGEECSLVLAKRSDREGMLLEGSDLKLHLAECRRVSAGGFRPVSVSVQSEIGSIRVASIWQRPVISEEVMNKLASRQANAAIALMRLGHTEEVWPVFQFKPDPRLRNYVIDRIARGADADVVLSRINRLSRVHEKPDASELFALVLSLGNIAATGFSKEQSDVARPILQRIYVHHPDAGVHSAAEWALRQMGVEAEQLPPSDEDDTFTWLVNAVGQTMSIVRGPVQFVSGSPPWSTDRSATEILQRVTIDHSFAISSKEVTVAQYEQFVTDEPEVGTIHYLGVLPSQPDLPRNAVTWFQAAAYCNWLSRKSNLPESEFCYVKVAGADEKGPLASPPDILSRGGYRLPTDMEFEYACRAGTTTGGYHGDTDELILKYAYSNVGGQGTSPVARLKPNDFGLFDALGNTREWCDTQSGKTHRFLMGGSFYFRAAELRAASRALLQPENTLFDIGFRVARTLD